MDWGLTLPAFTDPACGFMVDKVICYTRIPEIGNCTTPHLHEALDDQTIQRGRYAWKSRINAGSLIGTVTEASAFGFSNGDQNPVSGESKNTE